MSIIGETIVTVSLEMLFEKLASEVIKLFARQEKIEASLKEWNNKLVMIKAVLDDADEKQTTKQSVKNWLGKLQNLVYHVEDLLDEFETRALRSKLLSEQADRENPSSSKFQFQNLIPENTKFVSKVESEIKEISDRLQEIEEEKNLLDLIRISEENPKKVSKRQESTCLVTEVEVLGREEEKKEIVELLLRDDSKSVDGVFSVIPITGMGGLGKTTLAQVVYNNSTVGSKFDLKAWACVSEDYDAERVTKAILKSIKVKTEADDNLNSLQGKLKDGLSGKKFLIVLDDMWNDSYGDWTHLIVPFAAGAKGSKIIVTTRNQVVVSMMKADSIAYELKTLKEEDCMRLFTRHSLEREDFYKHPHLKDSGEKIVKKCSGLPLAAKTLGGLLRGKDDPLEWEKVLNSQIWELRGADDIFRALRVSYHFLPARLKRCFAHCSLLSKDYEFDKSEIVLLWMAEGLLPPDTSEKKMEEFGDEYFEELLSRSFFQQSSTDTRQFVMHDLINDLSLWAAGGTYFRMEDTLEGNQRQRFNESLRHFSYVTGKCDGIKRFDGISDAKHLRTFLPVDLKCRYRPFLSNSVIDMLLKLQRLKVLSFRGYKIFYLPNSIGGLKHLRHLDLSGTKIEILPESVSMLLNLNTLILQDCRRLKKLCNMGNLIKLHHLNNYGVDSLTEMPLGIDKLTCLQTLSYFVVEKSIRQLKSLDHLRGELKISRLENVLDGHDAKEAKLNGKKYLNELFLEWTSNNGNSKEPETEKHFHVLDRLKPHENLKKLTIKGYGSVKFPNWLGSSMFGNLVRLKFESCNMCTSLPSVGQLPRLEHLHIIGMASVKEVGSEFCGNNGSISFPSLKTLHFRDMQEWKCWIPHAHSLGVEVLPKLQEFSLVSCTKLLGSLPERLASLKRLVIQDCKQLEVLVPSVSTICEFEIGGCKKVVWRSAMDDSSLNSMVSNQMSQKVEGVIEKELPDLKYMVIEGSEELTYLWQTGRELLQDISSLERLKIMNCPKLVSFVTIEENDQQFLCRLYHLEVRKCLSLVKLPQALFSIGSLRSVTISHCDSLVSFPETVLPSQLRDISIVGCNALESLPELWMHSCSTSFESLSIRSCDSLTFIARVQLPPSLKNVYIKYCKNLRTLIDEEDVNCRIEELIISECPSLALLGLKSEFLRLLWLKKVPKLESIAEMLDNCTSLKCLWIEECENLVYFPEGGFPSTTLTSFGITKCEKLKSLPNNIHNLSSIQKLKIKNCPSIESFPEYGLPTNLISLDINELKISKPLFDWGLDRFTSMKRLYIRGCPVEDDTGMMFPNSLKYLTIRRFPNLERLSSSFENLTSLKSLSIKFCPKLQYFPEHGFPVSLLQLCINSCPLIRGKCKREGQYWRLIAHLPCVEIDNQSVYDLRLISC